MADAVKMDFRAVINELQQRQSMSEIDPVLAGEIEAKRKADEEAKARREWENTLDRAGIWRRYRNCTFENLAAREIPESVAEGYEKAKFYADNIQSLVSQGFGMAFLGPVGLMKTSLAVAVLQAGLKAGISGMFLTMPSLLDTIFTLKETNREEWARFEERLRTVGILLLDDLGTERSEGWVHTKIDAIVSERYNRMKPILLTSNLTGKLFAKTYSGRIFDRIRQTTEVVKFAGESLRESRSA